MARVIGNGLDLSPQRLREAHIQNQEKAAAVGQMAAGIAHEILNPLCAISGAVQILREHPADRATQDIYDEIKAQVDRVSGTLRQMLEMARPPRKEWHACFLNALVEKTLNFLRFDRRSAHVKIELHLDPNVPSTLAVEDFLSQVFLNLAINALDAMESNPSNSPQRLTVSTTFLEEGRKPIIRITFEDTGPGIPPRVADRIFEPYYTTKALGKGTGLGLPVSRQLVESHEGTLRAKRRAGGGACFVIDLPLRV